MQLEDFKILYMSDLKSKFRDIIQIKLIFDKACIECKKIDCIYYGVESVEQIILQSILKKILFRSTKN
jgi:hypothetical protein